MVKRATVKKPRAKATKVAKRAPVAKPKRAAKAAVKVKTLRRKAPAPQTELAVALGGVENSIAEIKSQIGAFESSIAGLVKRLEADRKALESRLLSLLADALSPFKSQILVPLQQEVSERLDGFGRQLTELAKIVEPASGNR